VHANRATGTMRSGSGRGDRRRRNIAGGEAVSTGTGECYGTGEAVQGRKLLVAVAITPREKECIDPKTVSCTRAEEPSPRERKVKGKGWAGR